MTLGKEWQQALDTTSEKDIVFEFLEKIVKEAIEQNKKYIRIPFYITYKEVLISEVDKEIIDEFAAKNDLIIKKDIYNNWIIMPKE